MSHPCRKSPCSTSRHSELKTKLKDKRCSIIRACSQMYAWVGTAGEIFEYGTQDELLTVKLEMTSLLRTRANRQFSHQCKKNLPLLHPGWRLTVKSWSASVINPVELNPKGAITVVFSQYNNEPKKNKKETSIIHHQYYRLCAGESCASL